MVSLCEMDLDAGVLIRKMRFRPVACSFVWEYASSPLCCLTGGAENKKCLV